MAAVGTHRSTCLVATYSGALGGAERVLLDVAARAVPCAVVACPAGPLADAATAAGMPVLRFAPRRLRLRGGAMTRARALIGLLAHARDLRAVCRALEPEVVVLWGMRSALAGLALGPRPARLVLAHQDLMPGAAIGRLLTLAARRADAVIVPSETVAGDLVAAPGGAALAGRVRVIAPGVALGDEPTAPGPGAEVLVLGALVGWKRPELALEACALARRHIPGLTVRLVGSLLESDPALLPRLRARAAAPDLDGAARLTGPTSDPAGELARANVLLHCAEAEPFGLVVAEALASGRPVVVPDAGGAREITDDACALRYPPGDAAAAAEALVTVLGDRERAAAMGRAGRRRMAERFDRERTRERFAEVLAVDGGAAVAAGQDALALVTVTHDSAAQLRALLASVERHLPGVRVIVVDCGSGDDSVAVARAHPLAVSVDAGANLGFGRGSNLGLRHVTAPVTAFVNPDVELLDDSLLELARALAAPEGEHRLLAPLVLGGDGRRQDSAHPVPGTLAELARIAVPPRWLPGGWPLGAALSPWRAHRPRRVGWAVGCAVAGRTDTLRRLGPFAPEIFMYGEDLELGLRAARAGVQTWFWPQARVLHHGAHASAPAYGGEPFELLAAARHRAIATARGERHATRDDRAQATLFASRIVVKAALRRDSRRERRQLAAVRALRG